MTLNTVAHIPHPPRALRSSCRLRMFTWIAPSILLLFSVACSGDKADKEPTVSVQVVAVEKTTIQHAIKAEAILFPKQQAAIVSKISAPVQKFLVQRGSRVHRGQLLAILENRDLTAAEQENKGSFDQAQAAYETTTAASLPEEIQKAEADAQQSKQALDAQEKVYQSRQQLFEQRGPWNRPKASPSARRHNSATPRFVVRSTAW